MSAPARRPRASGSCWGTRLGYRRPSNGYNAPGPLPRSALAASGVRVSSVGASRVGPRAPALGRRAGAALTVVRSLRGARAVLGT